jgi:hypothetical protein
LAQPFLILTLNEVKGKDLLSKLRKLAE